MMTENMIQDKMECAPKGANSLFRVDLFSEGRQNNFDRGLHPLKVNPFPLNQINIVPRGIARIELVLRTLGKFLKIMPKIATKIGATLKGKK